jgi:tripartite-type tricarboxylate transporter receptor subunit TctC
VPRDIAQRLFQATVQALQDAKLKQVLATDGTEALPSPSPEAFAAFLREETEVTARVIRESGAKFE